MVMRVVITGAAGLLGWHAHVRMHASNCAASFKGEAVPFDIRPLDRAAFNDSEKLVDALKGADAVLHFAGVNRADDDVVETENPAIAERLMSSVKLAGSKPLLVFANSTHAKSDTPYGRGKGKAADIMRDSGLPFVDLILPHIFGEGAKPFYNNVTATFIHQVLAGEDVTLNPTGRVHLLYAGAAAQIAIDAILAGRRGEIVPEGRPMGVQELYNRIADFHALYLANIYPQLSDAFDLALFNSYRAASYPEDWPRPLKLNTDARGALFEAVKGGGGGQTFLSTTKPGVTRGDHFHLNKVERFLVLQGEAVIRVRKVLSKEVWSYQVSGRKPSPVDMPTLHTHSIENVGTEELLTLFWTHDLFDPAAPDTYADRVLS